MLTSSLGFHKAISETVDRFDTIEAVVQEIMSHPGRLSHTIEAAVFGFWIGILEMEKITGFPKLPPNFGKKLFFQSLRGDFCDFDSGNLHILTL